MRARLLALALALAASTTLTACGDSDPTGTGGSGSVEGTYSLSTVNGSPLPVTVLQVFDYTLRVTAGNLVINAGNTFSAATTIQETESGQTTTTTETCTGTYTRSGNSLTFNEAFSGEFCGGTFPGTWNGSNSVTIVYDAQLQALYTR